MCWNRQTSNAQNVVLERAYEFESRLGYRRDYNMGLVTWFLVILWMLALVVVFVLSAVGVLPQFIAWIMVISFGLSILFDTN